MTELIPEENKKDFASLIVLAYNRPEFLMQTIQSIKQNTQYPYELIIVEDNSTDDKTREYVMDLVKKREVSSVVFNCGKNMGVGTGINRGFQIAKGRHLVKLDADLEFKKGWLRKGVEAMDAFPEVGMIGFFHYFHDPCDIRKQKLGDKWKKAIHALIVEDFVGSAMMIRKRDYKKWGNFDEGSSAFAEDWEYKFNTIKKRHGKYLALLPEDWILNFGFGQATSEVWKSVETKNPPATRPKVFNYEETS